MDKKENSIKFDKWKYYATVSVCVLSVGVIVYLLFRYALPIFIPFLIAFAIGAIVSPVASRLSEKTKIPRAVWGVFLTLLLLTLVTLLLALAVDRLMSELIHLLENLKSETGTSFIESTVEYISNLTSKLPILRELREAMGDEGFWNDVDVMLKDSVTGTVSKLAEKIPSFLGRVAAHLPEIFITVIVTLIATFYFSAGKGKEQLLEIMPQKMRGGLTEVGKRLKPAAFGWLRAYILIFIITFIELFLGLTLLRVQYAFLFAALIALVDILPILGTGTVLIPWSIISFLMKDVRLGVGLLIVFGVITVVREVIEPKIVGKSLGLSPILALISMYAGLKLFGFFGMIIVPAAVTLVCAAVGKERSSD